MAGAIAGTALINYAADCSECLTTITLTVNNICNLKCPHCYLQYNGNETLYIGEDVLQQLYATNFHHLVIVGKEPLVNQTTVNLVKNIVVTVAGQQKTVGLITNGAGLHRLDEELAGKLSYIDVSFDGGPQSYVQYRKGDFGKLIANIRRAETLYGFSFFNALHVLNSRNIGHLDDMVAIREYFPFKNIMFSPYLETHNDGLNEVYKLKLDEILIRLTESRQFMHAKEAFLLLDVYHLLGDMQHTHVYTEQDELPNMLSIKNRIAFLGLTSKVKLIEKDPIRHGFVRLTYDGYMLSPYASLNPAQYQKEGVGIREMSLQEFFDRKAQMITQYVS